MCNKYFKMFGCKVFCHDIYNIDTSFLKELYSKQVSLNDALEIADINNDDFYDIICA